MKGERKRFEKLDAKAFIHPEDARMLEVIKGIPLINEASKGLLEHGGEKWFYVDNIANNVRVNKRQCQSLYGLLKEACGVLDVREPEMYVDMDPLPNAYTYGTKRPFIVVTSGLVEMLNDAELLAVVGHEVGHIKCNHVLYKFMVNNLASFVRVVGLPGLAVGMGAQIKLYQWDRMSEFSADRAALLVIQDTDTVITVNMKLAGGSAKVYAELNKQEFLNQAREFEKFDQTRFGRTFKTLQVLSRRHPWPVLRVAAIDEWSSSEEYKNILEGHYLRQGGSHEVPQPLAQSVMVECPRCHKPRRTSLPEGHRRCSSCGKLF